MGKGDQRTLVDEVKKGDKPIYIAASRRHLISRLRRQLPPGEALYDNVTFAFPWGKVSRSDG